MILGVNQIGSDLKDLNLYAKLWLSIATLSTFSISLYIGEDYLGLISAISNIWCVILVANGKISNFFWGLIGIFAYSSIAYTNKYYGDVMLNMLYFLPMSFIGWYMWTKNNPEKLSTVKSKYLTNLQRLLIILAVVVSIFGYGLFLKSLGGNLPFVDASSTVISIVATLLLTKQYMEQWFCWISVNILTIYMWLVVFMESSNEIATLIQWIIFLINSLYGLYSWIKRHQSDKA